MKKLLLLIAVLLVAAGSWWYVSSEKDVNKNPHTQSQNTQQTTNDPSEGGKYLVIKEWGVRFQVPDNLKGDIEYYTEGDITHFGSKTLASTESLCGARKNTIGVGASIKRTRLTNSSDAPAAFVQINGYVYSHLPSDLSCNQNSKLSDEQQMYRSTFQQDLFNALSGLEESKQD